MNSSDAKPLELIYGEKKLTDLVYNANTSVIALKKEIYEKFYVHIDEIRLFYDKMELDDNAILSLILVTSLGKITGEKLKVRIIPQVTMKTIMRNFVISRIDESKHSYNFTFDVISTKVELFIKEVLNFFIEEMKEFNYKLESCNIYHNPESDEYLYTNSNELLYILNTDHFYFLIKNKSINLYKNQQNLQAIKDETFDHPHVDNSIELRKNVSSGEFFKIIIQTYNQDLFELYVHPDMSIGDLKEKIEDKFKIRKEYQELLYIVYRLNDDSKLLKDYYVRPNCTIFLRGFYFPVLMVDFYNKGNKNIVRLNAAKQISELKKEIISKLCLEFEDFKLVCNGKELNEMVSLIDYNIQKLQVIYIK